MPNKNYLNVNTFTIYIEIKNSIFSIQFLSSCIESVVLFHLDIVSNKLITNENSSEK